MGFSNGISMRPDQEPRLWRGECDICQKLRGKTETCAMRDCESEVCSNCRTACTECEKVYCAKCLELAPDLIVDGVCCECAEGI